MLPLKQNSIKKQHVNELLELKLELNTKKQQEYKFKAINNNFVYTKTKKDQLARLYYLVF